METETECYTDLYDWVERGSMRLGWKNFCADTSLDQLGLPSAKRYFTILYKFNGGKPLSEEFLIAQKDNIIKELFKDKQFVPWLTWFIDSHCSTDSWIASATIRKDRSIEIIYEEILKNFDNIETFSYICAV